jgi:uncharacterized protein (TIGR02453 family)
MLDDFVFAGFPPEALKFFRGLARHNDREWFAAHKGDYEEHVLRPAQAFVVEMGARLRRLSPDIHVDPRTNGSGSIFRIHRDIRFSKDKTPYKTHLGIFFWEGARSGGPGYYFHLEPPRLELYVGKYILDKPQLQAWRAAVDDPRRGPALAALLAKATRKGYELGGEGYKRVPAGFAPDHPRAALLRHDSVWLRAAGDLPPELHSRELLAWCFTRWRDLHPLQAWLCEVLPGAGA